MERITASWVGFPGAGEGGIWSTQNPSYQADFAFSWLDGEQAPRRQHIPSMDQCVCLPDPSTDLARDGVSLGSCRELGGEAGRSLCSLRIASLRLPAALLSASGTPLTPGLWQ